MSDVACVQVSRWVKPRRKKEKSTTMSDHLLFTFCVGSAAGSSARCKTAVADDVISVASFSVASSFFPNPSSPDSYDIPETNPGSPDSEDIPETVKDNIDVNCAAV